MCSPAGTRGRTAPGHRNRNRLKSPAPPRRPPATAASRTRLERAALVSWYIVQRRVLAQLQRANVRCNGPSIGDGDLRRVARHCAEAIGRDGEKMAQRRLAQPIGVKRWRRGEAALDDDPVAVTCVPMTGCAEDFKPLLPTVQQF